MVGDRTEADSSEVLVVGGGPTGMVAALVLAAIGVRCRVLERRTEPNDSSRALGLQARSMELLAGLGPADQVTKVAYTLTGASIMRGDEELVRMPWVPPEDSSYPYTYVLPQQGLEAILRQRLDELEIPVDADSELDGLTQNDQSVTVRLTDGRQLTARWLIGADGSRSRVREQLGIPFTGAATGEAYYLADTVFDTVLSIQDSAMWLGPEGPLMLMRLPGADNLWRIFVDVTDRARSSSLPEPTPDLLEEILQTRGPTGLRIVRADWTSIFRTRVCLADQYRTRVVYGAPSALLDQYEAERRPVATRTIRDVELRRRTFALRNPVARGARDLMLRATGTPGAARRNSRLNSQLDVSYARRRLARAGGTPPVPGDRAPDLPVGTGSIHDHIGPDHQTLVCFDPVDAPPTAAPAWPEGLVVIHVDNTSDSDGRTRTAYGMRRGGFVLIRPDGHIAERTHDLAAAQAAIAGPHK